MAQITPPKGQEAQSELAKALQQEAVSARDAVEAVREVHRLPEGADFWGAQGHME